MAVFTRIGELAAGAGGLKAVEEIAIGTTLGVLAAIGLGAAAVAAVAA